MVWIGLMMAVLCGTASAQVADVCGAVPEGIEPLSAMVFSDFTCDPCKEVGPAIQRLQAVYPGPVQVLFKHAPRTPEAWLLHEAALAADAQGHFWEMHDLIFADSGQVGRSELTAFAHGLGLNMEAFNRDLNTHRHRVRIERDIAEARALWVTGAPAFFVNGIDLVGMRAFAEFVETLAGQMPPPVSEAALDVRDAPSIGAGGAPVTVVSFVDLRCGFCARMWPVIAELVARYDGRVRWVFKHFPLENDALMVHQAVLSAGAQGRFWEMSTQILNHAGVVQRPDMLRFARELDMDVAQFEADVDSGRFLDVIRRDMDEGRALGIRGTPTFFVNGRMRVGLHALQRAVAESLASRNGHMEKENNLWLNLEPAINGGAGMRGDSARH